MNSVFDEKILADKLSKLNSTQQCIETLSHWCIFHRKKAEQVVQTWDKQFHSLQKEQKIPFLYLANDILQNSRRNGTEFVGEFWKVLPAALKDVENGDERGKNVVSRLVGIWEERRVFGSRAKGLRELMLGNEPPPSLELNNRKRSRSVRIVKRDSRSIKIKLSIGGTAEKIVSAFHSVINEIGSEDEDLRECKSAVRRIGKMEKDVDIACSRADDPQRAVLADELQKEETVLKQCIDNIKSVEANRAALVAQLKEALHEQFAYSPNEVVQESELEHVRTQLQLAHAQLEEAANMRRRLNNEPITVPQTDSNGPAAAESSKKTAAAIAAEVADRLAASTHSQQIMTSVLSTFAAEEAKNAGVATTTTPSSAFSEALTEKLKLEKPIPVPATTATFLPVQPQHQTVLIQQTPLQNQPSNAQPHYSIYPASTQQFLQPSGGVMIGLPYTYSTMPPPPPPLPQQVMNLARAAPLSQQQPVSLIQQPLPPPPPMALHQPMALNQQSAPLSLQQPAPPSYRPLQPPGMAFYPHQTQ